MSLIKIISGMLTFITIIHAQGIIYLENVPEKFKQKYSEKVHNYNPLHVGNIWQYSEPDEVDQYRIERDTIVNSKRYFKKIDYYTDGSYDNKYFLYKWERFDSSKRATYMLDISDEDNDGNTEEELLLDSLEIPNYQEYVSYRYYWRESSSFQWGPYRTHLSDSSWAVVFGDTVMTRRVEYLDLLRTDIVADKFGVVKISVEFHNKYLTGAIIDDKTYGIIVTVKDENKVPSGFSLKQNYPNPFNPRTKIKYHLPRSSKVQLKIYDMLGREQAELININQPEGYYEFDFDASNLSSGMYIYKITAGNFSDSKKMLLLK